jgi:threonylcarbamoyladenosine tRNA methylthiotransferase MtaB
VTARTIAFHTFGCKVNQYETEELREQMRLGGYEIVPMDAGADVVVVNSCSVTADADSSCRQLVRKVLREKPSSRVVVTGCYAERAPDELRALSGRVEVFGNHEKPLIAVALGVPTACVQEAARSGVTALADRTRAYIKIQDGCDAKCTYCIIPSVRPNLICRPPELILKEAQNLIARGFREIVLTGVRLGRYEWPLLSSRESGASVAIYQDRLLRRPPGQSGGTPRNDGLWTFARLIKALLNLSGDFRIRLSSIEVTEVPDEIVELAATHPKFCPFFHIPLQSGNDEILKRMGRWYTSAQYREKIRQIKARIPDVALSADVIVGFAGEAESHFWDTVKLLEDEGFSRVHAFRYSVRPGTPAERLKLHVDPRVKSERTREMVRVDTALRRRYAERFLGKPVRVLAELDGSGYTERYVRVRTNNEALEGQFCTVTPVRLSAEGVLEACLPAGRPEIRIAIAGSE